MVAAQTMLDCRQEDRCRLGERHLRMRRGKLRHHLRHKAHIGGNAHSRRVGRATSPALASAQLRSLHRWTRSSLALSKFGSPISRTRSQAEKRQHGGLSPWRWRGNEPHAKPFTESTSGQNGRGSPVPPRCIMAAGGLRRGLLTPTGLPQDIRSKRPGSLSCWGRRGRC